MTTWAGFPMGFRFTVSDFSVETKRACWQLLLSSLGAAQYKQVLLFESVSVAEYDRDQKLYLCILSHKPIKQSRYNAKHFLSDAELMTRLSVYAPIVQENALTVEAPDAALIGLVKVNGEIVCEDAGKDILPSEIPVRVIPRSAGLVLIAPDSMKGVFSASALAQRIGAAVALSGVTPRLLPIGDGGEGTMLALAAGTCGRLFPTACRNVRGETVHASLGVLPDGSAVVECAHAVGYADKGDTPLLDRSSAGVGDLILHAIGYGYTDVYVGVGGTSTSDCGIGMLHALGFRFLDTEGVELAPLPRSLPLVASIDDSQVPDKVLAASITVLVDSENPLLGESGAVRVYAPQKGASVEETQLLETGFANMDRLLQRVGGGETMQADNGAGGGIAFALARALGAQIVHGIDFVLDAMGFDKLLASSRAVVTAEGRFDSQSIRFGKATKAIVDRCEKAHVPCLLFAGIISEDASEWVAANCHYTRLILCDCSGGDRDGKLSACLSHLPELLRDVEVSP